MRHLGSALALAFLSCPLAALAQPATTPGQVASEVTLRSIGIEWPITGDDDHDATCTVDFRLQGAADWSQALPLLRVDYLGANTLAGSVLFLEPGASYEVRLTLSDRDGGSATETLSLATRPVPTLPTGGQQYHVVPGSGGGTGSESDPFQGIEAAEAVAAPGDTFLLHAGNYGGRIELDAAGAAGSYLVWKAAGDGDAIVEGIELSGSHTWLEGLRVEVDAGEIGIHGTYLNPDDVVIVRNTINGCNYCVYPKEESRDWYIADNVIAGDTPPQTDSLEEGVELNHGSGHIVAHNSITHVADGVSYPGPGCDIYGNDIFDVSDDGIEPDYGPANVRVWGNRISNANNNGISFQPMNGAPWYVIRNQVVAGENAIKIRDMDRAVLLHNTFVGWSAVVSNDTQQLVGAWSNNNLWLSVDGWYAWENGNPGPADWRTNLDYDGFDWAGYAYAVKWNNVRYDDLAAFTADTGLEPHGIAVDAPTCLESFDVPAAPPASMPMQMMTLAPGCNAIDAGVVLPGINDGYTGSAPDLGAYEVGAELPVYGPRSVSIVTTELPDAVIDTPYELDLQAAGGTQPYTWSLAAGDLPVGIVLDQGSLTGTPTELDESAITIAVTDSAASTAQRDFTLTVVMPGAGGAGGGGSGGQGGTGASSAPGDTAAGSDDGCGCSVIGTADRRTTPFGALALLGLVAIGSRRRRWQG